MRKQNTKPQEKKPKIIRWYPQCPHIRTLININHPHLSHSPINFNNKTMDMAFLAQMRQSNKCESIRKDEAINLHLGSGAGPWVSQTPARHQLHFLIPSTQAINQQKDKEYKNEIQLPGNPIVLVWPTYAELRVKWGDLEPSSRRGSEKINMLKQGRNTQKKALSYYTAWTHVRIPALIEVNMKPSAKGRTSRTRALVSLCWLSQSLHIKQSPNQISDKSITVGPIRLSQTWKKSHQIPKSFAA